MPALDRSKVSSREPLCGKRGESLYGAIGLVLRLGGFEQCIEYPVASSEATRACQPGEPDKKTRVGEAQERRLVGWENAGLALRVRQLAIGDLDHLVTVPESEDKRHVSTV